MSRKHAHRADNQPVTRRYVRSVVQRARDEIISAIVHQPRPIEGCLATISTADEHYVWAEIPDAVRTQARLTRYGGPTFHDWYVEHYGKGARS